MKRFNFWSAVYAGFIATLVMTIVGFFVGMDVMKILGKTAGMKGGMVYVVGGLIHLGVGIVYGLIYALIFEPLFKGLPKFLSGAIYSLLPFIIAMVFIGSFLSMLQSVFGAEKMPMKKTYGQVEKASETFVQTVSNENEGFSIEETGCGSACVKEQESCPVEKEPACPVHKDEPCPVVKPGMPCPYRSAQEEGYSNKDMMMKKKSKSSKKTSSNGMKHGWLWSFINHLIYGIVLGMVYRPKKSAA